MPKLWRRHGWVHTGRGCRVNRLMGIRITRDDSGVYWLQTEEMAKYGCRGIKGDSWLDALAKYRVGKAIADSPSVVFYLNEKPKQSFLQMGGKRVATIKSFAMEFENPEDRWN
jgi:hypothetical protein